MGQVTVGCNSCLSKLTAAATSKVAAAFSTGLPPTMQPISIHLENACAACNANPAPAVYTFNDKQGKLAGKAIVMPGGSIDLDANKYYIIAVAYDPSATKTEIQYV
jgi:hypothetical protein